MNRRAGLIVAALVVPLAAFPPARGQAPSATTAAASQPAAAPIQKEEIEQLLAPIALYPDSLVAQILMASTYPLEVIFAARWSKANPNVKGKALEDAMQKQNWDPSVKSLTAFPQVLAMMYEKFDLTQKLGDAFLADQKNVLDAIQRLRARADQAGNLKSSKEQTVKKEPEGNTTIIKIEPANPEYLHVPVYDPTVVYGPWPYPAYPPYYYYPYYPYGWYPGAGWIGFTAGIIIGGALWGGCNWGGGNVHVDHHKYNNFNRTNLKDGNWRHNVDHRKGVGYRDQATREKFGGSQRAGIDSREQFRGRAEQGRRDIARGSADGLKGVSDRSSGFGDRSGGFGERSGVGDRGGPGNRGSVGDRSSFSDRRGMSDRGGGFNGVGGGGGTTRDFSSRGSSSRGSFGGGGGFGGGRGGGGGGRGGRR